MAFFDKPAAASTAPIDEGVQGIALSAEEAAVARSMLTRLLSHSSAQPASAAERRRTSAIELAKSVYLSRKRRVEHFGPVLFSEPAWDMLLVLFIYGDGGAELSVTRLAEFSQSPLTTAIRWLDYLESQRLVVRHQCAHDRRKFFVELSAKGRGMMESYFNGLTATLAANEASSA